MITVFGSINIDLTFPIARLPCRGETVLTAQCTRAVGGEGANQAVAAARDGSAAAFIGCVGSDPFGAMARQAMAAEAIDTSGLATVAGATGLATIWVDSHGDNMIAVASGANAAVRADQLDPAKLGPRTILVLQMEVSASEVEIAIQRARKAGAKIVLNMAPAVPLPIAALREVDVLVLNEHEAKEALCGRLPTERPPDLAPISQLQALYAAIGRSIIITLGGAGAVAAHAHNLWRIEALAVTPIDTTGAGNCFLGVLAAALDRGQALPQAMHRASVAAGLACTASGAQPSFPTQARTDGALAQTRPPAILGSAP